MVQIQEREEWKSASTDSGAPSVTHCGTIMMLRWYVDNWDFLQLVRYLSQIYFDDKYYIFHMIADAAYVYFGYGSGPMFLDQLGCTGREQALLNCSHSGIGVTSYNCGHDYDAGVRCLGWLSLRDKLVS